MVMPRHLILVRHGQSEANVIQEMDKKGDSTWFTEENLMYADSSWRLTSKGVQQAKTSGNFIQDEHPHIDRFIVSPYKRTFETASYLDIPNARWEENSVVRERSWGEIDSIPRSMYKEQYSNNAIFKEKDPLYWRPPSGESIAEVSESRVKSLVDTLHRESSDETVLVVTHGEFIWASRFRLERWSSDDFITFDKDPEYKVHNASVIEYTRINPTTKEVNSKLKWVRQSYPVENMTTGEMTMHIGQWREFHRTYLTNEELLEKVHTQNKRFE